MGMAGKMMVCNACERVFRVDIAGKEKKTLCPKCGSEHVYSAFQYFRHA